MKEKQVILPYKEFENLKESLLLKEQENTKLVNQMKELGTAYKNILETKKDNICYVRQSKVRVGRTLDVIGTYEQYRDVYISFPILVAEEEVEGMLNNSCEELKEAIHEIMDRHSYQIKELKKDYKKYLKTWNDYIKEHAKDFLNKRKYKKLIKLLPNDDDIQRDTR